LAILGGNAIVLTKQVVLFIENHLLSTVMLINNILKYNWENIFYHGNLAGYLDTVTMEVPYTVLRTGTFYVVIICGLESLLLIFY